MTTKHEQETVIVYGRVDDIVSIYSSIPAHVRRLDIDERASRVNGDHESGNCVILADQWQPIAFRRRTSDAERTRRSALMKQRISDGGNRRTRCRPGRRTPEGATVWDTNGGRVLVPTNAKGVW